MLTDSFFPKKIYSFLCGGSRNCSTSLRHRKTRMSQTFICEFSKQFYATPKPNYFHLLFCRDHENFFLTRQGTHFLWQGFDAGFIYDWSSEDSLITSYTQHHMLCLHLSQFIFNSFFSRF